MKVLLVGALAMTAATAALGDSWFGHAQGKGEESLQRAHAAFLEKDFAAVSSLVRDVLADEGVDQVMKSNAIELIGLTEQESGGRVPADWELPDGISDLKFELRRKELPEGVVWKYQLGGAMNGQHTLSQIQLVRSGDEVVLDWRAGIGEWEQKREGSLWKFNLDDERERVLSDGLYFIYFEMSSGQRSSGWFILHDLASSASPELDSPQPGQVFHTGNPEFVWHDFRSPEYKESERRKLYINVGHPVADGQQWQDSWGYYIDDPVAERAVVGRDPLGEGQDALEPGRYWMSLTFIEQRMFGPLKLRRSSAAARSFIVR